MSKQSDIQKPVAGFTAVAATANDLQGLGIPLSPPLATLIKRNAATPNLQANVFLQADLPPHVRHHSRMPAVINANGSRRQAFAADGI